MRTSIGPYTVIRRLAGDVEGYLARSASGADCEIRLYSSPGGTNFEQAQREVGVCRRFDHGGVANPIAAFLAGSQLAVATAYTEGGTLGELVQRMRSRGESLPIQALIYAVQEVAGALAVAHELDDEETGLMGMCHGHLSPDQIMVGMDGSIRLLGLGLASLVGPEGIEPDDGYTAPEQRGGGRITPRGDIYSLCAVFWAVVADREPGGQPLDVASLGEVVPIALRDELRRGLAEKLSERKLTALELEQAFGAVTDPTGRAALTHAMSEAGSRNSAPAPESTPAPPPLRRGPQGGVTPPIRSKKATLLGNPLSGVSLDEPGSALAGEPNSAPEIVTSSIGEVEVNAWDHTIALEGNMDLDMSPVSAPVPSLDWGSDDPTTIKPRANVIAEFAAKAEAEAEAGFDLGETQIHSPDDVVVPPQAVAADVGAVPDSPYEATVAFTDMEIPSGALEMDDIDVDEEPPISSSDFVATLSFENGGGVELMSDVVQGSMNDEPAAGEESEKGDAFDDDMEEVLGVVDLQKIADGAPEEKSPWGGAESSSDAPKSKASWGKLIAIAAVTAVGVMAIGVWVGSSGTSVSSPPADPNADLAGVEDPSASPSVSATQPDPSATPSALGRATAPDAAASAANTAPSASASTAPSASASVTPSASAPAVAATTAPADDGKTGADLPYATGYLRVAFAGSADAKVYLFGKAVGPVNQKVVVPCTRPGFVRVGLPGTPIRWLSRGRTVIVKCRSRTEATFAPN